MASRFRFRTRATAMVRDLYATLEAAAIAAARRNNAALWYVPDSLGGVFQDLAGTALPALNAPIGLLLDRSFGVETLGLNLIANSTFDAGRDDWSPYSGSTLSAVDGKLRITSDAGANTASMAVAAVQTTVGSTYRVTVATASKSAGHGSFSLNATNSPSGAGAYSSTSFGVAGAAVMAGLTALFTATATLTYVVLRADLGATGTAGQFSEWDGVEVHEVLPAANRGPERIASPTDTSSASWTKDNGAAGANGLFTPSAANAIHRVYQPVGTGISTAGERVEATVKLKSNGIRYVYLNLNAGWGGQVGIDLTTGATVQNATTRVLPPTLDAEGFWTLTVQAQSVSGVSGSAYLWLQANNILAAGDATWAPNGTDGFYVKSASLRTVLGHHATQATAANKPTLVRVPRKLGPNIVANGDFSSGTSGWPNGSVGAGTFTVTGGVANFSYTDASNYGKTVANAPTVAGRSYYLTGNVVSGTAYVGIVGAGGNMAGRFSRTTVASGPSTYIQIQSVSGATSVDDIEIREVLEWSYAASFDGTNDVLNGAGFGAASAETLIFAGAQGPVGATSRAALGKRSGLTGTMLRREQTGGTMSFYAMTGSGVATPAQAVAVVDGVPDVLSVVCASGASKAFRGGVQIGATLTTDYVAASVQPAIGYESAGGSGNFVGSAVLSCYAPVAMTDADRIAIERFAAYLAGANYVG